MPKSLADVNVRGHVRRLIAVCESQRWVEFWRALECEVCDFGDFDLGDDVSDAEIWDVCQDNGVVLITANRNADDPDSLESTIRQRNSPACLPVLTLADPDRIQHDRRYAEQAAERLLEILFDLDAVRGAGRLYLP